MMARCLKSCAITFAEGNVVTSHFASHFHRKCGIAQSFPLSEVSMLEKCIINVFLSTRMIHFFSSTHLRHADDDVFELLE